ncbi:MAG: CBS domain-containing protein [Vicinamibacterales bacterium]
MALSAGDTPAHPRKVDDAADDVVLAAQTDLPVLIVGSRAEGRRRLAREIHQRSIRRDRPWMAVSCLDTAGASRSFPAAATGAVLAARMHDASVGSLFIDGLVDMSAALQARLLSVLESVTVADDPLKVSPAHRPRLITGASPALLHAVRAGRFSESLFYRLNVILLRSDGEPELWEEPMTARELMSTPPQTCQPTTDLAAVAHLMWNHDFGFVPVVDADGHLAGVITDRDICIASATRRLLPERIAAAQAMSTSVHACLPDDSLASVLATMKQHQVRRVPVVDQAGHLQGIVSMNDVVRAVGKKGAPTAAVVLDALAGVCAPHTVAAVA